MSSDQLASLEETTASIASYLETNAGRLIVGIILFFILVKLIQYLMNYVVKALDKSKLDKKLVSPVAGIIKVTSYFLLVLFIATFLGINTASIIMIIIAIAVLIAIAMQTTLSNIGSGVILMMIRPFYIGHYIGLEDDEGNVKEINLYHTIITKRDNSVVFMPNSKVLNSDIRNFEKLRQRRVDIDLYVEYGSDVEKIRSIFLKTIKGEERVLGEPKEPSVIVRDTLPQALKIRAKMWVKKADYWDILYEYNEKVVKALEKENIKFAYKNFPYWPIEVDKSSDN